MQKDGGNLIKDRARSLKTVMIRPCLEKGFGGEGTTEGVGRQTNSSTDYPGTWSGPNPMLGEAWVKGTA